MSNDTKFMATALTTATVLAVVVILLPLLALQNVLGDGPWMLVPAVLLSVAWLKASFVAFAKIDAVTR